jgi:hypothetical protein
VGDAAAGDIFRFAAINAPALETDLARRFDQTGDRAQRRCLAGAVGAKKRRDAALFETEGQAVERLCRTVKGAEILHFEQRGHQFACPR